MKTEVEITYIFIRYIAVTLERKANEFYKKQGNVFYKESQELVESKEIIDQIAAQGITFFMPEEFLEKKIQSEQIHLSLLKLTSEEFFILEEKFLENKSDAEIGHILRCSSQAISKKKRKIYAKLREIFSFY